MTQILAIHVIRVNQQSGSCAVESPQSRDSPSTMFNRPFSFPTPTQKKEKGLATRDYDTKVALKLQLPCKQPSFVRQIEQCSAERYRSGITTILDIYTTLHMTHCQSF